MKTSNKIAHTKKALIQALEKSLGVVTTACRSVGIERGTFYRYCREDKEFSDIVKELDNVVLDFVESKLHKQIMEDNTAATIFFLKTKGKNRGYIERTEHTGVDGESINIMLKVSQDQNIIDQI